MAKVDNPYRGRVVSKTRMKLIRAIRAEHALTAPKVRVVSMRCTTKARLPSWAKVALSLRAVETAAGAVRGSRDPDARTMARAATYVLKNALGARKGSR